ncbi:MAG: 30S ribosomal protein S5 [Brevinematales bacterium]|nr:30S ribosomal protein S5 [Brevinematales bacterium]
MEKEIKKSEWMEKVVSLRRAAKVTSGGKRFRFNALVVVGNGKGMVGIGYGKANELTDAIRKAKDKAIRSAKKITLKGTTIPHEIKVKYKGAVVFLKPASEGTGVIAGGAVRPILEMAGIHNILTKSLGSPNALSLVRATLKALESLMDVKEVAMKRGKSVAEIFGSQSK